MSSSSGGPESEDELHSGVNVDNGSNSSTVGPQNGQPPSPATTPHGLDEGVSEPEYGSTAEAQQSKESVVPEVTEGHTEEDEEEDDDVNEDDGDAGDDGGDDDDNEEGEDDDDDEDEEEEEEEEPKLKYSRINGLPPTVFTSDAVSTFLVMESFLVFATHRGMLHLLRPDMTIIRSIHAHSASVLSLSSDGHYLASASIDGTVVIGSVEDSKDIVKSDFKRPVHAVALDPNYKTTKVFVSGGMAGSVVYSQRNWFGSRVDTELAVSDYTITALYWVGSLILWMNEDGITVFSTLSRSKLLVVPRPKKSPRADLYKPRLCVPESNRIYLAWVDHIWVLKSSIVKAKINTLLPSGASALSIHPEERIEVELHRKVDWLISGIAPYGHDTVMLLTYQPGEEGLGRSRQAGPPELKLVDLGTGEEVYADEVSMRGYERLGLDDYHLSQYAVASSPTKYFVVSAKDGIIAMERDLNDRMSWLLERRMYRECWQMSANMLEPIKRMDIGIKGVELLLEDEKWAEASHFLADVIAAVGDQRVIREEWERWGWILVKSDHIDLLARILPTDEELGLEPSLYQTVIDHLRVHDLNALCYVMSIWPTALYNSEAIKGQLEDLLSDQDDSGDSSFEHAQDLPKVRMALANLYTKTGDPLAALNHLLVLHHATVVDHISQFHLLPFLTGNLIDRVLMHNLSFDDLEKAPFDVVRDKTMNAIRLFVDGRHQVPPSVVIEQLRSRKQLTALLFFYLEELNRQDPFLCKGYGDLQVMLYAEFDRPQLVGFLHKSNNYNLTEALEVCEKNNYIPELVYLLGKVGQNQRALRLIIEKIGDPEQALDFARAQNDKELWADLLRYSMKNALFIRVLLEKGNDVVDAVKIIRDIPENTEVPGLKPALLKIFADKEMMLSLTTGVLDIVKEEAIGVSKQLRARRLKGDGFDFEHQHTSLDLSKPIILTPESEIVNEHELIGKSWSGLPVTGDHVWSVSNKVARLRQVLRNLSH